MMEFRIVPFIPRVHYNPPPPPSTIKKYPYRGWKPYLIGLACLIEAVFHFVTPISVLMNIILLFIGITGITVSIYMLTLCAVIRNAMK